MLLLSRLAPNSRGGRAHDGRTSLSIRCPRARHLGAELISSDDVALYELVKNGFDAAVDRAAASTVSVEVEYHLDVTSVRALQKAVVTHFDCRSPGHDEVEALLRGGKVLGASGALDSAVLDRLCALLPAAGNAQEHAAAIGRVNSIRVVDAGTGMSESELDRNYLTIGTSYRLEEHRRHATGAAAYAGGVPPTGEKGIGRLSMMRLGREAVVRTARRGDRNESVLTIDWRRFVGDGATPAQEVAIDLRRDPRPTGTEAQGGTAVEIYDLEADWPLARVEEIGGRFLSKFFDPFRVDRRRRIALRWNGAAVNVPRIGDAFLTHAPAGVRVTVRTRRGGFDVACRYWFMAESGMRKELTRTYASLDFGGITADAVAAIGPFELELYHYNRRRLAAIPGVATREEFREWLDEWSGGLKLYRDGVRVMPYGQGDSRSSVSRASDDWLDLDGRALRGKGFRVNRIQVVGCVRVGRGANPRLIDQANREGLVDNAEARTFVTLLKAVVDNFVTELDGQVRPAEADLAELHDAAARAQDEFEVAVGRLVEAARGGDRVEVRDRRLDLDAAVAGVRVVLDDTQRALEDRQLNRIEVLELAATGVAAESFAHDLEATLDQAIADTTGGAVARARLASGGDAWLAHLRSIFKALRLQISAIKPGPARHRRQRTTVEVGRLLAQVENFYTARLERHRINWRVMRQPRSDVELAVYVVEGHLRQVLDNLVRNSIYWLKQTREKDPAAPPAMISVTLDARGRTVRFADSGSGVAVEDVEWVFGRFHSRRQGGRGLGLYLSRELCEFNGVRLSVDQSSKNRWGRFAGFVLEFGAVPPPGSAGDE